MGRVRVAFTYVVVLGSIVDDAASFLAGGVNLLLAFAIY
jgi:hypothetical protein